MPFMQTLINNYKTINNRVLKGKAIKRYEFFKMK